MNPILVRRDICNACFSCLFHCPAKAIRAERGAVEPVAGRCVGCGICLNTCPRSARTIRGMWQETRQLLQGADPVWAVVGGSFPAQFSAASAGQLVTALRMLGFAGVVEAGLGVDLLDASQAEALRRPGTTMVCSRCPAVTGFIQRHYPGLLDRVLPLVSPAAAVGRLLKQSHSTRMRTVYITACMAAGLELADDEAESLDAVLTLSELQGVLSDRGIALSGLLETPFDMASQPRGRLLPLPEAAGVLSGLNAGPLDTDVLIATGAEDVLNVLNQLSRGAIRPRLAHLRFCRGGCIAGPGVGQEQPMFVKRNQVVEYAGSVVMDGGPVRHADQQLPLFRLVAARPQLVREPKRGQIRKILQASNKFSRRDELNCRACGYATCQEFAASVAQGLGVMECCLPYRLQRSAAGSRVQAELHRPAARAVAPVAGSDSIVGVDGKTHEVLELIKQVGPTPTTVLIRGESGTGKELTARAIHRFSMRSHRPLVTVNCTTLSDSLLESELFGHKKGSFTGAVVDKAGLFEAADGGTIFLDEIGDITAKLQAKLLRVLDSGEVRPVGGTTAKRVDVRLIAATNRNLEEGVRQGWFREDLYYRLNVFSITMPPLRSRSASITILAQHFLEGCVQRLGKEIAGIEERALAAMSRYNWPGNIRELQNVIERAAVLTRDGVLRLENLPAAIGDCLPGSDTIRRSSSDPFRSERQRHLAMVEQHLVEQYLDRSGGNVALAARMAGIPRRTFYRLLERYGLRGRRDRAPSQYPC